MNERNKNIVLLILAILVIILVVVFVVLIKTKKSKDAQSAIENSQTVVKDVQTTVEVTPGMSIYDDGNKITWNDSVRNESERIEEYLFSIEEFDIE